MEFLATSFLIAFTTLDAQHGTGSLQIASQKLPVDIQQFQGLVDSSRQFYYWMFNPRNGYYFPAVLAVAH